MEINKADMTLAYLHKDEPQYFNQFINYIDQIGNFCVRRLKIDPLYRDDVKQIAVEHAFRKMDHYNPDSGSAAYSFFYKVILRRCLYELRDMNKKKKRMPDICSLEKLYNSCPDDYDEPTNTISNPGFDISNEEFASYDLDSDMVFIDGSAYNRSWAIERVKIAKTIVRREKLVLRRKRLFSLKTDSYYKPEDDFVSKVCVQIVENKEKKANRQKRSK